MDCVAISLSRRKFLKKSAVPAEQLQRSLGRRSEIHEKEKRAMLGSLGLTEILLIIAAVLVLFFGGRKLPELARGIVQGIRQFRQGLKEPEGKEDQEKQNRSA